MDKNIGKLVFAFRRDDEEGQRLFIKDPREMDYDVRNGWWNTFSLQSFGEEPHVGMGLYRISDVRYDKNDNTMFILKFIREISEEWSDFSGSFDTLGITALMSSDSFYDNSEHSSFNYEYYNAPCLCEALSAVSGKSVDESNMQEVMTDAYVDALISTDTITKCLRTPTPAQIEAKRLREEQERKDAERYAAFLAEQKEKEHQIFLAKVNFIEKPDESQKDFPYTVAQWKKEILRDYPDYKSYLDSLYFTNLLEHYFPTGTLEHFVKKYSEKYAHEVELGHIQELPKDAEDFAKVEAFLAFDIPRKAAKKAEKTAKKKAKNGM